MSIKLELYKVFKTVYDYKNISEAAKALFISQSAVSQSLKQLEQQSGVTLFQRTQKGVIATAEGIKLYEYISSAMDLIYAGEKKLEAMKNIDFGELKIAVSDTISRYLLLPMLEKFHARFSQIKLQIINGTTSESIALLKSGKVDLAFINMPINDKSIDITPYLKVHDVFVASPLNTEFLNQSYSLEQIAKKPLILLEKKSNSRVYVQNYFNENKITLTPEIELGSHDLLLEFAKINLGVSCVVKEFSLHYLNNNELIQIKLAQPIPARQVGVASLKGVSLTTTAKEFLKLT